MKKLIETYSKMEAVVPAAIQLIYKGNPVNETDTPISLNLSSDDVLEVCRVPGNSLHDSNNSNRSKMIKHDPGKTLFIISYATDQALVLTHECVLLTHD